VGVYGPNSNSVRRLLGDELTGMLNWWNFPWCIGGDFNVTQFSSERSGEPRLCPAMAELSDFMFYHGLMDLPLVGGTFIWVDSCMIYSVGILIGSCWNKVQV
jgi:hypothetical protein